MQSCYELQDAPTSRTLQILNQSSTFLENRYDDDVWGTKVLAKAKIVKSFKTKFNFAAMLQETSKIGSYEIRDVAAVCLRRQKFADKS